MGTILKTYIYEVIEVEKAGLEVNFKKNVFINIQRRYPIDIFDSLWHKP